MSTSGHAHRIELTVNGRTVSVEAGSSKSLLEYLRRDLGLTGTKNGCSTGHCGTCTVLVNGTPLRSCAIRMDSKTLEGAAVETIEGIARDGRLHPLQAAFVEHGAVQCGFCTPGMIMSAKALLAENPSPSPAQIRRWLTRHRNLCRCTGYLPILRASQAAAEQMAAGAGFVDPAALLAEDRAASPRLFRDAIDLVQGRAAYSDDLQAEGMLYGRILWSAHPHAEILAIDCEAARALEGVATVITARDVPGENIAGILKLDQPAIAQDRVRFVGDPVAAVFAETPEIAQAALERIQVDYRELEGVFSPEEAARSGAVPF